jgi:type IV secretion system protein VirB5
MDGETVLLLGAMELIFSLAHRPIANRYIRIDEMGRAQAIAYSDLDYSPREGEVRTYLTDWADYRYTISRDAIAQKYPLNYYFLSQALASQLMTEDNANHLVSQVVSGQLEQSDVEVKNVTITSMSEKMVQGVGIARGTALVTVDRLYSLHNSREPRTERWGISVTYYLNPKQVSDQAKIFPQFETINPLGLTITEFHENRLSVDPIAPGANAVAPVIPPRQLQERHGELPTHTPVLSRGTARALARSHHLGSDDQRNDWRLRGSERCRAAHPAVPAIYERPAAGGD